MRNHISIPLFLMLFFIINCNSKKEILDSDLLGTWTMVSCEEIKMEGTSEYQFLISFKSDHTFSNTKLRLGKKREGWGTWQLINDEQGSKLYTVVDDKGGSFQPGKSSYSINIESDILTLTSLEPESTQRDFKKTCWQKNN